MILPRRENGEVLLQSWTNAEATIIDGFGSFYRADEGSEETAQRVLGEWDIKARLTKAAQLQYYINKPTGLVDLRITIYFADVTADPPMRKTMQWFKPTGIPYAQMHPATGKWLPLLLNGQVPLEATVKVNQQGDHTKGIVTEFIPRID